MKKIILLFTAFICFLNFTYGQAGQLDSTFGVNGIVATNLGVDFNSGTSYNGRQVLLQKDGSIFILIEAQKQGTYAASITKRLPDGSLDSSYGSNGFSNPLAAVEAHAAMQQDDKIIVVCFKNDNNTINRFNTNGSIDKTFGSSGQVQIDFRPNCLAIQKDGKILVGGNESFTAVDNVITFSRFNTDGSLDTTFGNNGKQETSFDNDYSSTFSIAIQPDGKIIIGASVYKGYSSDFGVARYNTDGSLSAII